MSIASTSSTPPLSPAVLHRRAIVLTWPHGTLSFELAHWLFVAPRPASEITQICGPDVARIRNQAVRDIVLRSPAQFTEFLFCDWDMRPGPATAPFLEAEGDIVGCLYPVPCLASWSQPNGFHLGLARIARRVFETLSPPWFRFEYSADGAELRRCECQQFAARAREAGFRLALAGWCEHSKYLHTP